jgi:hypothetical protein
MPGFFWSHSSPARVDDYRRSQVPGCSADHIVGAIVTSDRDERNVWNCRLMSPTLFKAGDEGRKDVWGGKHGTLFPHFVTIENETQAASDHAAVVVEINID